MHRGRKRLAALRFVYLLSVAYLLLAQAAQAACPYVGGGTAEGGGTPRGCPALVAHAFGNLRESGWQAKLILAGVYRTLTRAPGFIAGLLVLQRPAQLLGQLDRIF